MRRTLPSGNAAQLPSFNRWILAVVAGMLIASCFTRAIAEVRQNVSFRWEEFNRMVEQTSANHLDAEHVDMGLAYVSAADGLLRALDPPVLILPKGYADPAHGHRLPAGKVVSAERDAFLLIETTPAEAERFVPGSSDVWSKASFSRQGFEAVVTWVEQTGRLPAAAKDQDRWEPSHALLLAAARGFLARFDSRSTLLEVPDINRGRMEKDRSDEGIGALLKRNRAGEIVVHSPLKGSSAFEAGIHARDVIRSINGLPLANVSLKDAVRMIRGPAGSKVVLEVERPGLSQRLTLSVKRRAAGIPAVTSEVLPGKIGLIRIQSFLYDRIPTSDAVRSAYYRLLERTDGALSGLLIDLRDNTGGDMREAVNVAGQFLPRQSPVLKLHQRDGTTLLRGEGPRLTPEGFPIMILMNANSSGASEIVAAALRDNGAAILVGDRTYGSGSVQTLRAIGPYMLQLTTGRFESPLGREIHFYGVMPDIPISDEDDNSFPEREGEDDMWTHRPPISPPPVDAERSARAMRIQQSVNLSSAEAELKAKASDAIRPDFMLERALVYFRAYSQMPQP